MRVPAMLTAAALALLPGCNDHRAASPAASTSAAAAGAFDGSYRGTLRLTRDGGQCGDAVITRVMVVRNGAASMLYNRDANLTATGVVDAAGRFELAGGTGTVVRIGGRIEGGRATGQFESRNCTYTVDLVRAG